MGCRSLTTKGKADIIRLGTRIKNKFKTREMKFAERAARAEKHKALMQRIRP